MRRISALPTMLAWATLPGHEQSGWPAYRLSIVRRFAVHLHAIDPATEVPPADVLPWRHGRATPYLYSDDEVTSVTRGRGDVAHLASGRDLSDPDRPPRGHGHARRRSPRARPRRHRCHRARAHDPPRPSSANRGSCRCIQARSPRSVSICSGTTGLARRRAPPPCLCPSPGPGCGTAMSSGPSTDWCAVPASRLGPRPVARGSMICGTASRCAPCSTPIGLAKTRRPDSTLLVDLSRPCRPGPDLLVSVRRA